MDSTQTNTDSILSQSAFPHTNIISTGLEYFRLNPFCVLRLPVSSTSKQALWQAERILSLVRLNLPPQEPDPIPWLPSNNEMEVKQAAQKLEEPLQRILEQLFWFDFARDPKGELLFEALLQMDPQKLLYLLQIEDRQFTLEFLSSFKEAEPYSQDAEDLWDNGKVDTKPEDCANSTEKVESHKIKEIFAHTINKANLKLLLALSIIHGSGPLVNSEEHSNNDKNRKPPTFSWGRKLNLSFVLNPHELLDSAGYSNFRSSDWKALLAEALYNWSKIISNSYFPYYLKYLFDKLGDELLDEGAIDTIIHAIPTRLADILVGEIKLSFNENSDDCVSILIDMASKASFNQRIWKAPFKLLFSFFQTELFGLNCLLVEDSLVTVTEVQIYFKRIEKLNHKWKSIDPQNLLGLSKLLDDIILKGFNVIIDLDYIIDNTELLEDLLKSAAKMSHSQSLWEKINSYLNQISILNPYATCYFCNKRKNNSKFPLVIKTKPIIVGQDGEKNFLETQFAYVPRCENCARFHQFIVDVSITFVIISISISIIAFAGINEAKVISSVIINIIKEISGIIKEGDGYHFILVIKILTLIGALFIVFLKKSISIVKGILEFLLVPRGQKPFYKLKKTKGYRNLLEEGYRVKSFDESKNALQKISKKSKITHNLGL